VSATRHGLTRNGPGNGRSGTRGLVARAFRSPPAGALAALLERIAPPPPESFAVLTYHRIDEPEARPWLNPSLLSATPVGFEAQMSALLRRHHPIGLPELLAARRAGRPLPERAVVITFDDAYRDFLEHAWPVLARHGIPATLFVPTAYPDADGSFWWDRLWRAVDQAPAGAVESPIGSLQLDDAASRRAAARGLVEHVKRLDHDDAMASVAALLERLGGAGGAGGATAQPDANGPSRATGRRRGDPDVLRWEEIRRLAVAGLGVAPHSRTHALMTRLTPAQVGTELEGSRADLEERLGNLAFGTVFAYPAGAHSAATRDALARLGFELGFTTERGINRVHGSDPLSLRRINVGLRSGPELVRAQMAFFTLRYRTRGV
jgi:peptidoglycan/xylan/chitin deacetylase (PgdA/CDA1 family)